jgi:urease accessory protein UreF
MVRKARFNGKVHRAMKIGEDMRLGTVEWELNHHKLLKEQREEVKQWAHLQTTRAEREHEPLSIWRSFFRIFLRYWPE